jgi:type IV secretion system protein VirD4
MSSHHFNPLSTIRVGTHHEADDALMIADLLVIPESAEGHWDTSAKALIAAVIRHVLHTRAPELQTLATVRDFLAAPQETLAASFAEMAESGIASIAEEGRVSLASLGSAEMISVIKNAAKALGFWSRDRIGGMLTAASDFDFLDMHHQAMTVFIVVPEEKLATYRCFMRLMMGCALAAAVRGKEFPPPRHKPLLLVDECAALGYIEALAGGLGYLRAYARTLLVFQDLGQLRRVYGEHGARSFAAAAGAQVAFNVNDNETAREVSESLGNKTALAHSHGESKASTDLWRRQVRAGLAESARRLLDASEVRRLPPSRCIVFLTGCYPLLAWKVRYYTFWRWRGRWDAWRPRPRH